MTRPGDHSRYVPRYMEHMYHTARFATKSLQDWHQKHCSKKPRTAQQELLNPEFGVVEHACDIPGYIHVSYPLHTKTKLRDRGYVTGGRWKRYVTGRSGRGTRQNPLAAHPHMKNDRAIQRMDIGALYSWIMDYGLSQNACIGSMPFGFTSYTDSG